MAEPTHVFESEFSHSLDDEHRVIDSLMSSGMLSEQSLPRVIELVRRFCSFQARAFSVESLCSV